MRATIGDNIARLRRPTGMTQEALAERAGLSVETIRKLEQNKSTTARVPTLAAIARALGATTSALLMGDATRSAAQGETDYDEVALRDVRRALTPARGLRGLITVGPDTEPPTLDEVRASLRAVDRSYHADDYATALSAMPSLLAEARAAVETLEGDDQVQAYGLLAHAHQIAGHTLTQLRSFDLAHQAMSAGMDAAQRSGDEVASASNVITTCWLLVRQARFDEAEQLAIETADVIEPSFGKAPPERLVTWGWLMLRASASAARDGRDDEAEDMLDAAAAAAVRVGNRGLPGRLALPSIMGPFSHRLVEMKRVENAVIARRPDRALLLAERVPSHGTQTSNNINRYQLDIAWAHTQTGAYAEATEVLLDLRRTAPTWLRHQRFARDIVAGISSAKRRAMTRDLAELAELVGLNG